jgi:hypothetical protein
MSRNQTSDAAWMQKIMAANNPKKEEPPVVEKQEKVEDLHTSSHSSVFGTKTLFWMAGIFLLALIPRLILLFFFTDPQNTGVGYYSDSYHHWQIAYLSKEIGLSHGFLRLWDLKGLEYFWGLAHPLVLMILMFITGSHDIVLNRLLSVFAGSINVVLLFFLVRKYSNTQVALTAALFGAFNPVGWFNDITGMVEPLGIVFLLSGALCWPRRPILAGVFLGIASMARAEHWLFAAALVFLLIVLTKERAEKKFALGISYLVVIGVYMKYLLSYTGNPIYPIWWNFLGNAAGKWQADVPLTPEQAMVQPIWVGMFIAATVGTLFVLWRRPKSMSLHLLGLFNFAFLGFVVGLTAYMKSYVGYFWYTRLFILPYFYLGFLIGLLFFVWIPKLLPFFGKLRLGWLFVITGVLATQFVWYPLWSYYAPTYSYYLSEVSHAKEIASVYKGGTVLIHEGDPVETYELVRFGVPGKNIEGQMYDPFTYKPFTGYKDLFSHWDTDRKIILNWLRRDDIRLIVFHKQRERYVQLMRKEPGIFHYVKTVGEQEVYEVTL